MVSSELDNYQPISRLSMLAKVLESFLNEQVNQFLTENKIVNEF